MNLASPWCVQIAMLPMRRAWPDDKPNSAAQSNVGRAKVVARKLQQRRKNVETIFGLISIGPMRIMEIERKSGLSNETVRSILNELKEAGRAMQTRPARRWSALCQ